MANDIDVFYYLEELLIKKDLDDDDWYHARTNRMILGLTRSLQSELVDWVATGEKVSNTMAKKAVAGFVKDVEAELRKDKKDEPIDVDNEG